MIQEKAKQAALNYVEAINTKNLDMLLNQFADDGKLTHPFGLFEGKDKLAEFYGGIVMHADTTVTVHRSSAEGHVAVIEVSAVSPQAPDTPQWALDLFEVNDDGKIIDLAIYYRSFDLK